MPQNIGNTLGEIRVSDSILNLTAISFIIIIGYYLLASALGPLVDLNNQTFKVIFTLVGGIPSVLFYLKIQTNEK